MDEVLDEFENCPHQIIYFRVTSPGLLKTSIFNLVISITPLDRTLFPDNSYSLYQIRLKLDYEVVQCILFQGYSTSNLDSHYSLKFVQI